MKNVTLNLTLEQAFYLRQVLWSVSGPSAGPRGQIDKICVELYQYNEDFKALELPKLMVKGDVRLENSEK